MTDKAHARISYDGKPPILTTTTGVEVEDNGSTLYISGVVGDLVLFHEGDKYRLLKLPHDETTVDVQAINGWNFDFQTGKFTCHTSPSWAGESVTFDCHEPGILDAFKLGEKPSKCFERIYWAKLKLLGIEMFSDISLPHEYARVLASMDTPLLEHRSHSHLVEQVRKVRECFEQLLITGRAKPFRGMLSSHNEETRVLTQQVIDTLREGYEHVRAEGQHQEDMYQTSKEWKDSRR